MITFASLPSRASFTLRLVATGVVGSAAAGIGLVPTVVSAQDAPPVTTYVLPSKDSVLQEGLRAILREEPFRTLVSKRELSIALVDLSDPAGERFAGIDENRMRYAASLPKIAVMLAVFQEVQDGRIKYTPELRSKLELMIRKSDNRMSTEMIKLVGFPTIERVLRDPRYELYTSKRQGGLWVGRDYGGWIGLWRRDPLSNLSHGATARQVARFLVMMQRGELVSAWASAEMKSIMADPAIHHKFVLGLEQARPRSTIFRKSGTWRNWHSDAALVERDGYQYVAVGLMESSTKGVLAKLIVRLDELIVRVGSERKTEGTDGTQGTGR